MLVIPAIDIINKQPVRLYQGDYTLKEVVGENILEIAKQFERGREYDEKEVNEIIHRFHEDHCTIRREMIACGIMARQKETYWLV